MVLQGFFLQNHKFYIDNARLEQWSVLTDLTLVLEKGLSFQSHSLVLAAVSTVIQKMLQERTEEKMCLRLGPEVSGLGLSAVLEFAYTGNLTGLDRESLAQIQKAALYLGVPRVLELCKEEEDRKKRESDGSKKVEEMKKISAEEQMEASLRSIRQLWAEGVGCDVELEAEGIVYHGKEI
uniref:BTB domain-containing protein n=1 Tax=Pygocentrus nattereri TaxID=42514 RepID=A0AAR2JLX1_PYGNA